jgi:hypothetical protein
VPQPFPEQSSTQRPPDDLPHDPRPREVQPDDHVGPPGSRVLGLAGWLVEAAARGLFGAVNATGPAGMTTFGGLLETCREVTGSNAEWVPMDDADLLAAGVQEWVHLPL